MNRLVIKLLFSVLLAGCAGDAQNPHHADCPQPRFTGKAPEPFYSMQTALETTRDNIAAGETLFQTGDPVACAQCHGRKGDGLGPMSSMFDPPPRNFTCAKTVNDVPDGQLFWIIRNGSPGTSMPDHRQLSDRQIWQLVLYLRQLANGHEPG